MQNQSVIYPRILGPRAPPRTRQKIQTLTKKGTYIVMVVALLGKYLRLVPVHVLDGHVRLQVPRRTHGETPDVENGMPNGLVRRYQAAVAETDFPLADTIFKELAPTTTGRKMFPSHAKSLLDTEHLQQLASNVKALNTSLGGKSKHRAAIATRVTAELPPQFYQKSLAFDPAYVRQAKKREREASSVPLLVTESRAEVAGRVIYNPEIEVEFGVFFESRTHIISGGSTNTRKLLMPKWRCEAEGNAEYPEMLRRAAQRDPSLIPTRQNQILTKQDKDVLAALHAAGAASFLQSVEYSQRLEAELDRRTRLEVEEHLRKNGCMSVPAPGREQAELKSQPTTLASFDPSNHEIKMMASATFWKVPSVYESLLGLSLILGLLFFPFHIHSTLFTYVVFRLSTHLELRTR